MSKQKNSKINYKQIVAVILLIIIATIIENYFPELKGYVGEQFNNEVQSIYLSDISEFPEYNGKIYITLNGNKPNFTEKDYTRESFENYSELDSLGRCGVAYANICRKTMPPAGDERGDISIIKPSGWKQKLYNNEALYNRCHLIAYQLSDEDDNSLNLITGTRYFNVEGMLPFENKVAEYVRTQKKNENKHVLYRVTQVYKGNNLVASGVQMEAYSVEDNGEGVCFNVFVYNIQPGITIDYATGESSIKRARGK